MKAGLLAGSVAGAVAVAATARVLRSRWLVVVVNGMSMTPTLQDGQRLIVRRRKRSAYETGEIVVFPAPEERRAMIGDPGFRVKRVMAVAGDVVPPWMHSAERSSRAERVPAGMLVVSGDNPRTESSRQLGFIPVASVVATVDESRLKTAGGEREMIGNA